MFQNLLVTYFRRKTSFRSFCFVPFYLFVILTQIRSIIQPKNRKFDCNELFSLTKETERCLSSFIKHRNVLHNYSSALHSHQCILFFFFFISNKLYILVLGTKNMYFFLHITKSSNEIFISFFFAFSLYFNSRINDMNTLIM